LNPIRMLRGGNGTFISSLFFCVIIQAFSLELPNEDVLEIKSSIPHTTDERFFFYHKELNTNHTSIILGFKRQENLHAVVSLHVGPLVFNESTTTVLNHAWSFVLPTEYLLCKDIYFEIFANFTKYTFPSKGTLLLYKQRCSSTSKETSKEQGNAIFSILLYVILIACCLYM